jgi:tetratricopeptide (TPR) repeat protein
VGAAVTIPLVSTYRTIPFLFTRDFLMFSDGQFRPLSYALLAAVRTVVPAEQLLFWHLWLLGFVWLAAVLIYVVAARLLRLTGMPATGPAAIAAFLFALHPLTATAALDVNQFHLLLGVVFYLAALAFYVGPGQPSPFPLHKTTLTPPSPSGRGKGEGGPAVERAASGGSTEHGGSRFAEAEPPSRGSQVLAFFLFLAGIFTSKVAFTLPVVLLCYDLCFRRSRLGRSLLRLLPYVSAMAMLWPFWWVWRANPLHYRYHPFPEGFWRLSVASSAAALLAAGRGLVLGTGIPAGLGELAGSAARWADWRVLGGAVGWVALGGMGLWALRRRSPLGLGLLLVVLGPIPFVCVAWNQVPEPVAWTNFYVSLAGLALVVGSALGKLWPLASAGLSDGPPATASGESGSPGSPAGEHPERTEVAAGGWGRRLAHVAAVGLVLALLLSLGSRTFFLAASWADPARYWGRVLGLNPQSARTTVALGKVLLERGKVKEALPYLFAPPVTDLSESAAAMALSYARRGEPLAALIHMRSVSATVSGIVYGRAAVNAEVMESLGALDYAEASWGKLLVGNPYNTRGMKEVARVLAIKGFVRAARQLLDHALAIDPGDREARALVRRLQEREQNPLAPTPPQPPPPDWLMYALSGETSVPVRQQIVRLSEQLPGDPLVQAEAATILLDEGYPQEALAAIGRAIERLPKIGDFWAVKALALDLSGDPRGAAQAAQEALTLAPFAEDLPVLYNLVGVVMLNRATNPAINDPQALEQAIAFFQEALKAGPELQQAHANLGFALAEKGAIDEALTHLRRAIAMAPTDTRSHILLATVLERTGDTTTAREMFQRALAIDPTSILARLGLGNLLGQLGDREGAEHEYRQVLSLKPEDPEALNGLGLLLARAGDLAGATDYFRRAVAQAPANDGIFLNLVQALEGQGAYAQAVRELRDHGARTGSPTAAARLAWLLATAPDDAVRSGREAVTLAEALSQRTHNQDVGALVVLAAAYAEVGRFDDARRVANDALRLAQAAGQEQLVADIRAQLERYQAGAPLRLPGQGAPAPAGVRPLPPG